jgi:hypothetical protein
MAPHGVIGGTPMGVGRSGAARGGLGTRGSLGARVNPVGGMIGENGAMAGGRPGTLGARGGAVAGGASASPHAGMYGQGGTRRSGRRDEADGMHWDPDNPWETAEGVDPVVLPSAEQRIDPGPAIGLG